MNDDLKDTLHDLKKAMDALESGISSLEWYAENGAQDEDDAEENRVRLETAENYRQAASKEIALLLKLCLDHGVDIPLEGHFVSISHLAHYSDPRKWQYEEPDEDYERW